MLISYRLYYNNIMKVFEVPTSIQTNKFHCTTDMGHGTSCILDATTYRVYPLMKIIIQKGIRTWVMELHAP